MTDRSSPDSQLALEWVYGYRGHQCRNNLYYTASGEVVYFVAGVGVVYDLANKTQRFFLGHSDDIISLAVHPDKHLVATAQIGKAPFVCVWDSVSLETVSLLQGGHDRGIAALAFSGEGQHLASVGLDDHHSLNVWDWAKGRVLASTRGHSDKIFDVQFNPHSPNTLVTCGVKHIKFWTLCGNSLSGKKGIFGRKGELQTILSAVFASPELCYSGTLSGDVYQWKGHTLHSVIKNAHSGSIYTMHASGSGFATGSRDGCVRLWDTHFKPVTTLDIAALPCGYKGVCVRSVCWGGPSVLVGTKASEVFEVVVDDRGNPRVLTSGHTEGELWALATHPQQHCFATGSDDKTIRLWDMSGRRLVSCVTSPEPVRSLAFSLNGAHLAAGLQDGSFIVLNTEDLSEVCRIKKRKEVIHELKYSPDGGHLAVGSNDNFVDVYSVGGGGGQGGYKLVGQCSGSSSFITHLDWAADGKYIQTNSGASERLYHAMPGGKRVTSKEEIQGIHWATWTSVLGPEVNGIWPKYTQVNDINATNASFQQQTIVTGDDFGLVKLFRFPCIKKGAKFKKYVGHSAHVTNVRFTHDQSHVISVGGADNAVFQWQFVPPGGEVGVAMGGALESDSEASDSEMSDVASLDSDLERETEKTYDRNIYREDLSKMKEKLKSRDRKRAGPSKSALRSSDGRKGQAPDDTLTLQFVHGYRGYDCRGNLYYTSGGSVVYHVAALGVVYSGETNSQTFYSAHSDDILCLAQHPSRDVVATGQVGRDPAVHVWETTSLDTLAVLKGQHSRGVCAVAFSADGKKLASVGLDNDHTIVVWSWAKGECLATARGHKDKLFMISWNPHGSDQLVTVGIKHIKFWTQAGGGFTSKRGVFGKAGKPTTMLCVEFGVVAGSCFTGGADGHFYHWEGSTLARTVPGHKGPVFALQRVEKGFVSGGKDGVVCLWDEALANCLKTYQLHSSAIEGGGRLTSDLPPVRALALGQGKILVGTKHSEVLEIERSGPIRLLVQGHGEGEAWGLAVHPRQLVCASASDDGTVRVWDLATHCMLACRELGRAARCAGYSHDGAALAIGMKDGSFVVLDGSTLEDMAAFHHRKEEISDVKFSPNGKYLGVASHDNFVDLYNIASKKRVGICKGASSYITHIDWDQAGKLLQLNTGDSEVLYFEAPRGKQQLISRDDVGEVEWASWTCVLGDPCTGIWPAYTDVTDVNAACRSCDTQVIATGDDFGFVKLFKFPSYGKHAKCRQYVGHSAHVTNVRFSHDDRKLISLGGADTTVMVWSRSGGSTAEADQAAAPISSGYISEDSDTDSEEEGGYDSDVEREKAMDYSSKTYAAPIRDAGAGVKPHLQEGAGPAEKGRVSRSAPVKTKVVTSDQGNPTIQDLSLEFIFGYRGFDSRQNLLYGADGSVLYHAAGAGVVLNTLTKKQSFYLEHTDDIICLAVSRNPKLSHVVATGQIGRTAPVHVWDYHSKATLSILQGAHSVGVCSVDFSCNGKLLVCVGLDTRHSITVWRWDQGTKVAQAAGSESRIFVAQFRPDSSTKFVTCGVKHVQFWTLAGTELIHERGSIPKTLGTRMQTMLSLAFAPDGVTFTGSISGDVFVWRDGTLSRVVSLAHSGPVFAMYTCLQDGLIVTAGKERSSSGEGGEGGEGVKLWGVDMSRSRAFALGDHAPVVRSVCRNKGKILVGTQNNKILEIDEKTNATEVLVEGHAEGEVWGVAVHPSAHMITTVSHDKTVRSWDLESKVQVAMKPLPQPACSVAYSPDGATLAVGQNNGEFVLLVAADLTTLACKRDRNKTIQAIRFSPDGSQLAVGSDDACVDVYSVGGGGGGEGLTLTRVGYCRGIPSFVTHLDWAQDGQHLQVCTGAYQRLVFKVPSGKQITAPSDFSKIIWASWTSVLGNEVLGVWPKDADKADVNTANLSHSGVAVATGDDFGCVKLFDHFPIPEKFALCKKYFGHSAHVTCVRFSHDDQYLLSAGGDDSCIFVWRVL